MGRESELRTIAIERNFLAHAEGSVLISAGDTKVICTATVDNSVPPFLKNTSRGWLTAEYAMLPRATPVRRQRAGTRGKIDGRTHEIQRLIGRSLRMALDLNAIGERTIILDCDVIQADGGTRTTAITGACVALVDALFAMKDKGMITAVPLERLVAAVSVGIVRGAPVLDLCYAEDSTADLDLNVVMTSGGRFIEVQGTAEREPFDDAKFNELITLARRGIGQLVEMQKQAIGNDRITELGL